MTKRQSALTKGSTKNWGMFVYIAGDNNLSDNGLEDISEMCAVGASPAVHAGVEIDTYGDHTGSIRYEITEPDWTGKAHRTVIQRLREKDSGNPATLTSFALWALRRYSAKNRLMVIWNHGSGFRSVRRDIAFDDFGSSLDMPEVESALGKAGIGTGQKHGKLSILGFDACLMCLIEVAHHFKDIADYLVGSQQTEPGDGWPYDQVLGLAHQDPTPKEYSTRIVDAYISDYRSRGVADVTQSAIDLGRTPRIITALHHFGRILAANLIAERPAIQRARVQAQSFEFADYVDLIHLAKLIATRTTNPAVKAAASALVTPSREAILHSKTLGSVVSNASGLSVWFPADAQTYFNYRAKYLRLHCNAGASGWVRFLDTYFA